MNEVLEYDLLVNRECLYYPPDVATVL